MRPTLHTSRNQMLQTFSVYLHDRPGTLNRVGSLFHKLGINIESLTVGHSERRGISRMTIGVEVGPRTGQIEANLHKLVDVTSVEKINGYSVIAHELALIKICAAKHLRVSLPNQLVNEFHARVVARSEDSLILEAAGTSEQIDILVEMLRPCLVLEVVRTGQIAMTIEAKRLPRPENTRS